MTGRAAEPAERLDLAERDRAVLAELARSNDGAVAFQGLRRSLNLHQQVLSRSLRRLAKAGLVTRGDSGYKLTSRAPAPAAVASPAPGLMMARILLPPGVRGADVANRLAHRWFNGLRWYGRSETPEETHLTWMTDAGGGRVHVRVVDDVLTIELDPQWGAATNPFTPARGLLSALADLYGGGTALPNFQGGPRWAA